MGDKTQLKLGIVSAILIAALVIVFITYVVPSENEEEVQRTLRGEFIDKMKYDCEEFVLSYIDWSLGLDEQKLSLHGWRALESYCSYVNYEIGECVTDLGMDERESPSQTAPFTCIAPEELRGLI